MKNRKQVKRSKLIVITAIIFPLLIIGAILFFLTMPKSNVVKIYQGGTVLHQIDLEKVKNSYDIEILGEGDRRNIVLVEQGKISMKDANCSDLTCVKKGEISPSGATLPIVCLPNSVIIAFEGAEGSDREYDIKVR